MLTKIDTLAKLRRLCLVGGKGVLIADISGDDLVDSLVHEQRTVINVAADVTLYDDGTTRSLKRTAASNQKGDQFIEVVGGVSLKIKASAPGKIVFDGNETSVNGNGYFLRLNSKDGKLNTSKSKSSSAELENVLIKDVKNSGTGTALRLDHSKGADVSLVMKNCTVQGCETTGNGGVISNVGDENKAIVYLNGCTFTENKCKTRGPVMYCAANHSEVTLENCTFTNNKATNTEPIVINKDVTADITLIGVNKVNSIDIAAAAKATYGDVDSFQYWPAK